MFVIWDLMVIVLMLVVVVVVVIVLYVVLFIVEKVGICVMVLEFWGVRELSMVVVIVLGIGMFRCC